jgi:hypothetical protein
VRPHTETNRLLLEQLALGPQTTPQLVDYFDRHYPVTTAAVKTALSRLNKQRAVLVVHRRHKRMNGLDSGAYVEYLLTERGRAMLLGLRLLAGEAVTVRCDCCGKTLRVG